MSIRATTATALSDAPGPRARRRHRTASIISIVVIAAFLTWAIRTFQAEGQFEWDLWQPLFTTDGLRFLWGGLGNTLKAAAAASVLSLTFGLLLAVGRLADTRPVRWLASTYVESARVIPLLILVLVIDRLAFRTEATRSLAGFWALVIALTLYNAAVLAEVFRAGVRSLPRGQREAGLTVGLTNWQTMRIVQLPQAIRLMLPAIVNQIVTILMDTSLGQFIAYPELLRRGGIFGEARRFGELTKPRNALQAYIVTGAIYVIICFAISRISRYLEHRPPKKAPTMAGGAAAEAQTAGDLLAIEA